MYAIRDDHINWVKSASEKDKTFFSICSSHIVYIYKKTYIYMKSRN